MNESDCSPGSNILCQYIMGSSKVSSGNFEAFITREITIKSKTIFQCMDRARCGVHCTLKLISLPQ